MTKEEAKRVLQDGVFSDIFRHYLIQDLSAALKAYNLDENERTAFRVGLNIANDPERNLKTVDEKFSVVAKRVNDILKLD